MITADQLKELTDRVEKLRQYLNIEDKIMQLKEEEIRTQTPDFWDNPKAAEEQMKKVYGRRNLFGF